MLGLRRARQSSPVPGTPTPGAEAVDRYLVEVAGRLPGPASAHSGIVAELRSGLLDATDSHRSAGLPHSQAVQAAVREFGDPELVAEGFRTEIAASHARRVALIMLVTGPAVGLLWLATAMASHLAVRVPAFWEWARLPAGVALGIQLVVVAAIVTGWAAALGIAVTGRLSRWLPTGPKYPLIVAAIAGFGAVGADALGILLLVAELASAPGRLSPLLATAAAAASVARLLLARRAAFSCLAMRASLA